MKTLHLASLLLLASYVFAPLARAQLAAVSPVMLQVEQASDDKRTRYDESQKKTLKISLTNSSAQEQTVKLKYYYFAKDIKDHTITVFKEGDKTATVKAHGTEMVEAEPATAQSTEKHGATNGKYNKNAGDQAKNGAAEASGQRLIGYGVQVFQDDKLATEYFSEPSLKSNVGGGGDKSAK
jgi:hypothetical protein